MKENKLIAELLAAFNDNPNNSEVVDYITRTNYFDLIGKSRNEMVHSRMIAEILAGRYFQVSRGKTLLHFFDIVMKRAQEQKINIPIEFRNAILTRSKLLDFTIERKDVELSLSDYLGNKSIDTNDKQKRLDVYLQLTLPAPIKDSGRKKVEIFLENKVLSSEHDNQTQVYYDNCSNSGGKGTYQFFIYLSPLSSRDINNYNEIDNHLKPSAKKAGKPVYIHICYQDILDKVIEPLLVENRLNSHDAIILKDYVNCLELVSMSDDEDNQTNTNKALSIMAISNHEKTLIEKFLDNEVNKKLFDLVVSSKLNQNLYSYNSKSRLTFNQVLIEALKTCIANIKELETITLFEGIISRKNNGTPLVLYGKIGDDGLLRYIDCKGLYEFKGKVYKSLSKALTEAIIDYSNKDDLINNLNSVYGRQRGGQGLLIDHKEKNYNQINGLNRSLYIRSVIHDEKLDSINAHLSDDKIRPVTNETFCNLLTESTNDYFTNCKCGVINIPNTNVFFRENIEKDKQSVVISRLANKGINIKDQQLDDTEKTLIDQFFNNNRNLVVSIYRIMLEKETDRDVYNAMVDNFNQLIKIAN